MTPNLHQMTNAELKKYISASRNNDLAFRAALEVLMSRRNPNAPYQPYPILIDLNDPKGEVQAILAEKLRKT